MIADSVFGIFLLLVLVAEVTYLIARVRRGDKSARILADEIAELRDRLGAFLKRGDTTAPERPAVPPVERPPTPAAATREAPGRPAAIAVQPPTPPPLPPAPVQAPAAARPPAPPPSPAIPPAPATPRPASPMWASVRDILRRIWQWILVGEEFRPAGVTMEYAVATTWLMRAGIVVVVLGVGYFLKLSIEHGWINPPWQVGLSVLFGIAMLCAGVLLLKPRWQVLGHGFMGGGIAILYFSMYAAGPLYHLLDTPVVFGLMILVTIAAGVLSVATRSMLVAILGIVGGFGTPVMLRTGEPHFLALYSYMLLLDLGILGIAHFKQWRLLNYLGFAFTYILFFASLHQYQRPDFPVVLTFLSLFFVVQCLLVYLYNLRRGDPTTLLEIGHLILNAAVYSAGAYWLIRDAVGRPYPALMTLALAAFYALHVVLFLQRRLIDRPLLVSLLSLAGLFASLTLPLVMEKESLTLCLALLAFTFLWLGGRLNSHLVRHFGYLLYGTIFIRLIALDLPRQFGPSAIAPVTMDAYWPQMTERLWTIGLTIVSVLAAFFMERREPRSPGDTIAAANDTPDVLPPAVSTPIFFWAAILFLFAFLQLEFHAMLAWYTPLRPAVSTILWCALAAFFLGRYLTSRSGVMLGALVFCSVFAVAKSLFLDMPAWSFSDTTWVFGMEYTPLNAALRWLDLLSILALVFAVPWVLRRRGTGPGLVAAFGYGGLGLLFAYLSLELNTLLHWKLPVFQEGGVSVFWTAFAFAILGGGIWRNLRPLRYGGLALFAVVVGKVFLIDLSDMPVTYRVVAFLAVGALLLLGSFAYLYANRKFRKDIV